MSRKVLPEVLGGDFVDMSSLSDVSAVVLTIGEDTTTRAVESIQRQSYPVKQIILIGRNVVPFYRALNLGASRVETKFFIQVDSDMILDDNCVQLLRDCMEDDVGLVEGYLRDPLMGRVGWVKLFRKKCFETVQFRDLVSPDVVFRNDISRYGWKSVYAGAVQGASDERWHTFGEHQPSYTPHYTYSKYIVEGRRFRYRNALGGLLWQLKKLEKSDHPVAFIAQIALANGIFIREETDLLKPYGKNQEFDFLENFLTTSSPYDLSRLAVLPSLTFSSEKAFKKNYQMGIKLGQANAFPAFKRSMELLSRSHSPLAWVGKVALCHGLFAQAYLEKTCAGEYELLKGLLAAYTPLFILKAKLLGVVSAAYDFRIYFLSWIGAKR